MAFLASLAAPLLGAGLSMIGGNMANKQTAAAQQSQQNYAQGVSQQGAQLAQAQQLAAWYQMMQRYQQYMQQNPNPANTWQGIQAPQQIGGQIGGGQIGSSGNPQQGYAGQMPTHMPQQNLSGLLPMLQAPQGAPGMAMPGTQQRMLMGAR